MINEVFGDATRGGAWAAVRLELDDETIVAAAAPGLDRSLEGLTLVEAAAVGGDPLAVEALASALGPAFTATPRPGRVAVAMSGGVDSAVALVRAGPDAIGVKLRLWQDPAAPDTERAYGQRPRRMQGRAASARQMTGCPGTDHHQRARSPGRDALR